MNQEYFEAILVWTQNGPSPAVHQWLTDRGLQIMPMRQGLLIRGDRKQFEAAFQLDLKGLALPAVLPIPSEWRNIVLSVTVPKPPDYLHQQQRR